MNTLAKALEPHVHELADFVEEMQEERGNNEGDIMSDNDSKDADFNEAEQEPIDEYDDTSLDEESLSSNEGLDDMELEFDTEDKMSFGREIIYVEGDRNLVVNKMIRVFNEGVMWSRNRDGSVSLVAGDIFASKQDML